MRCIGATGGTWCCLFNDELFARLLLLSGMCFLPHGGSRDFRGGSTDVFLSPLSPLWEVSLVVADLGAT